MFKLDANETNDSKNVAEDVEAIDADLTIKKNDADREFTHAKFLNENKVQQRYEQIQPIMAKTVGVRTCRFKLIFLYF